MKINVKPILLALLVSPGIQGAASAVTVLIDFGTANAPSPYNLVPMPPGAAADSGIIALTDTTTAATPWTVNVAETGSGNGGTAGAGANVPSFPAGLSGFDTLALQDSIFANQGGGTAPSMVLTFAGLDAGATYDILLYGSRNNAQGLDQRWSLTQGTGGADVEHFSELNDTTFVDWSGISPNGGGVIAVTIDSPGPDSLGALALNFGSITEVPEPATVALLAGFFSLALIVVRRRK